MLQDPRVIPLAIRRLFLVACSLERVADHATNIAEMVIYMMDGTIVRRALA